MVNRVMVAMSGGVDSSVAAALLKEQSYEIFGVTFKLFDNKTLGVRDRSRTCCSLDDVEDARRVAYRLGFDHFVFNFGDQFKRDVIQRFAEGYLNGKTPNPCIDCNRFIKFSRLMERAKILDAEYIATGHYAQVVLDEKSGRYLLKKARDISKDQSYVLYALKQEELSRLLFPLGSLLKSEVRSIAEKKNLVNAKKPDSQDICFVPDGDYAEFLQNVLKVNSLPGDFIDRNGTVLGTHKGLLHYTIGQRKGLNLSFNQPKYVIGKDQKANTVTLGDESELYSSEITIIDINLIACDTLTDSIEVNVKIRYSHIGAPAILYPPINGKARVEFFQPQRAATPGQAVVFYQDDTVIGGGTIIN